MSANSASTPPPDASTARSSSSSRTGQHASAFHNVDRSSARVMAQAVYQPTAEEYAEYERRAEARKAAKAERQAARDAGAETTSNKDKAATDDTSSVFSFRSLASTTSLLRKSEKK